MRIVTKVNLTLLVAVVAAAVLNFAVLQATVMPSFEALERASADRNEARALEAVATVERQVASIAGDYAVWDETYAFLDGRQPDYAAKNLKAEAMQALGIDFVALVDASGRVVLDRSFVGPEAGGAGLLGRSMLAADDALRAPFQTKTARFGLTSGPAGLTAVAYAPVHDSAGGGVSPGVLLLGRVLDVPQLREMTQVDFDFEPVADDRPALSHYVVADDVLDTREELAGLDGRPLSVLVTRNPSHIVALGETAVGSATGLTLISMLVVVACLGIALRLIAVRRIERIRRHLSDVTATGALHPMPLDRAGDELSETIAAFNAMAAQLSELRGELRRRDYRHGAADLAAVLLDNIRTAISPVAAIAWDRDRRSGALSSGHLATALDQLGNAEPDGERAAGLKELIALSACESLKAAAGRPSDLRVLHEMIRHVEEILREEDRAAKSDGAPEVVGVGDAICRALRRIDRLGLVAVADVAPGLAILGHRVTLDQILDNLLVNAAQAIEAAGRAGGRVIVAARVNSSGAAPVVEIAVSDTGEGTPAGQTAEGADSACHERSGGLGLSWCAEAVKGMGGRLAVDGAGEGRSATLRLTLPAVTLDQRSAA